MATQVDVNNAVNAIVNQYTGQTISYYGSYPGECTVPVAYYVEKITGHSPVPSMAGAGADGWGISFPAELAPYFSHAPYQAGVAYPKGTILMWNSPHIAIVLSSDGSNTVEVFEQNADPDGSPCGSKSRVVNNTYHTCTYALIPIVTTDPPPKPYYTVVPPDFTPKQVVTKQPAVEWDCSWPDLATMEGHVGATQPAGYQFQANALLHHNGTGDDYYLQDAATPTGYLVTDCEDYVPPPPVVTSTSLGSYTPTTVKPAQMYTLVTTVPIYDSSSDATMLRDSTGTFPAGSYYVYDTGNGTHLLNITNTAQKASCKWVADKQNVLPPVIPETPVITNLGEADETWKATYKPFNPGQNPVTVPVQYKVTLTYTVLDLDNKRPNMQITEGRYVDIYGTFVKDNITYYRPRRGDDVTFDNWYGIPVFDTFVGQAILTKPMPTKPLKKTSLLDKLYEVKEVFKEDEVKFLDIIPNWFRRK